MRRSCRLLTGTAISFLIVAVPAMALSQSAAPKTIMTSDKAQLGTFLTDGFGTSLYLFEEDRRGGDRGRTVETDCLDKCLERWPAFLTDVPPVVKGAADPALVGSFKRPDGGTQATYNGWPLYYFAEDFAPGDTNGHDLEDSGGEWYLLTPAGHALGEEPDDD